jgi:hypothetical protein
MKKNIIFLFLLILSPGLIIAQNDNDSIVSDLLCRRAKINPDSLLTKSEKKEISKRKADQQKLDLLLEEEKTEKDKESFFSVGIPVLGASMILAGLACDSLGFKEEIKDNLLKSGILTIISGKIGKSILLSTKDKCKEESRKKEIQEILDKYNKGQ